MASKILALAVSLGDFEVSTRQLATVLGVTLAMEEAVDAALHVVLARHEMSALRVAPRLRCRLLIILGLDIAGTYGMLRVAMMAVA